MSLIVCNASAGSGKTYTLALKYLTLALKSNDIRKFSHILAVTFTNKATTEMKNRILKYLFSLSHKECNTDEDNDFLKNIMEKTGLSEDSVRARSCDLLKAIMQDYDHFKVETIDSFFQSLLTSLAHELGLPRGFKVDLDDANIISQAIDQMLLTLDKKGNKPLLDKVKEFLENYIDEKENWNISKELKEFTIKNIFQDVILDNDEQLIKFTQDPHKIQTLHDRLRECIKKITDEISNLCDVLDQKIEALSGEQYSSRKKNSLIGYSRDMRSLKLLSDDPSETITGLAEGSIDTNEFLYKKYSENQYKELNDACNWVVKMEDKRKSMSLLYNTCVLTLEQLGALSLLGDIDNEINHQIRERGTHLLAKTPQLFYKLVKKEDSSFIYERLGTNIENIMIDEFQDTSRKQYENFKKLLFELLSNGNECMVVGDIKQSIYRWRGGDWDILYNIQKDKDFTKDPKTTNFRSEQLIVRFNNAFFVKAAKELDGQNWHVPENWHNEGQIPQFMVNKDDSTNSLNDFSIQKIYADVEQIPNKAKKQKGYVYIHTIDKDQKGNVNVMEEMYKKIILMNKNYKVPFKEMIILVRKNGQAKNIIDYFEQNHPTECTLTTEEAFMYDSSHMINCLVYALKFLDDNNDTVSYELSKKSYLSMCQHLPIDKSAEFMQLYEQLSEQMKSEEQKSKWERIPLFELSQHIIQQLHFAELEQLGKLGQSSYLFSFLDSVIQYVDDNSSNLHEFLAFWDETLHKKAISTHSDDSIKIMTIHKAKGLEAHTVFIPFADFEIEKNVEHNDTLICNVQECVKGLSDFQELMGDLPVIPIHKRKSIRKSIYRQDYELDHLQQKVDNLNTLYVAFTRAIENLFIWSEERKNNSNTAFQLVKAFTADTHNEADVQKDNIFEYGHLQEFISKKDDSAKSKNPFDDNIKVPEESVSINNSHLKDIEFMQSSKALDFILNVEADMLGNTDKQIKLAKQQELINNGVIYHELFSRINTLDDLPRALEELREEGILRRDEIKEKQQFVENAIKEQEHKHWFDGTYKLHNECNILYFDDGVAITKRPDRVMENDNEAIVIDYKFGGENKGYDKQIANYRKRLHKLLNKPVKAYLWYVKEDKTIPEV